MIECSSKLQAHEFLDENLLACGKSLFDNGDLHFFILNIKQNHKVFLWFIGYIKGGVKLVQIIGRTDIYCNIEADCAIPAPLDFIQWSVTSCNPTTLAHKF